MNHDDYDEFESNTYSRQKKSAHRSYHRQDLADVAKKAGSSPRVSAGCVCTLYRTCTVLCGK